MNKREKQKAILDVFRMNKVGLGALFETKVKQDKVKEMVENNFPNWEFYSSHLISGRILILWQSKFVQVEILHEDAQLIHCKIKVCGHKDIFLVTAVYGSNSKEERKALWTKLSSIGHPNLPWVILGDFNAMFSYEDRNGGRQIQAKDIEDAQDWLASDMPNLHRLPLPWRKTEFEPASEPDQTLYIHSSKSPGLDGFGSGFFINLWKDIGDDISKAVLGFFTDGRLPKSLNETVISLIPKVVNPLTASDYRPIACCNTIYKCISKMICSRLAEVLPILVQSNQGAFVKNRLLAHNIMVFQDLLKGYLRKNISARCIMKIDLSKAYDTVDWQFVEDLLNNLCFPSRFINWIMTCLKGTSYNLLMNGRIQGKFKGEKGLRQGDPMSPLIFVLIMEYLTRLLAHFSGRKGFGFHPLCKHLKLTSLCFADDLIIFCKGNLNSVRCVNEAFMRFCQATGLSANKTKSHIYFGGVRDDIKAQILDLVRMEEGSFPLKYLGVKLRPTKWKTEDCGVILDKINKKLNCWASRNLSFAGRAQLIHSVLLGIGNYWMSIFTLPSKVIAAIDKSCRDFLWGTTGNRSKLHFASWEKVCLPKEYGGVGFREGKKWNKALMAKFLWAIARKQDSLWVKWVNSIYLKGQNVWSYSIRQDVSWYFKKLMKIRSSTNEISILRAEKGGKFHAKLFYNLQVEAQKVKYSRAIWNKLIIPKHRFILWQACNVQLLTRDHLSKFLFIPSILCPVCENDIETHTHLFFDCVFARKTFVEIGKWLGVVDWPKEAEQIQQWCTRGPLDFKNRMINSVFAASLYLLWKNRNSCIFDLVCSSPLKLSMEIRKLSHYRILSLTCNTSKKQDKYIIDVIRGW
ncbi:hypothetical protein CsatB_029337 [Cannabis sativa]